MPQCSPGNDLIMLAASIAITVSSDLSAGEVNILAGLFNAVGDNLSIIAAKKQNCENVQGSRVSPS